MNDLVGRLRKVSDLCCKNPPDGGWSNLGGLLKEAADEIEHLRSVAGAVSRGPSQREISGSRDLIHLEPWEISEAAAQGISVIDYAKRKRSAQVRDEIHVQKAASCPGGVTDLFGGADCTRVPGEE